MSPPMTQPDLARLEVSARTLEQALEQNFRDGTLAGAVEIIASTIADPIECSALEEAATRLAQVPALLARVRELEKSLEPFAREAARIEPKGPASYRSDDVEIWQSGPTETRRSHITYGDLRRAALTLNKDPNDAG